MSLSINRVPSSLAPEERTGLRPVARMLSGYQTSVETVLRYRALLILAIDTLVVYEENRLGRVDPAMVKDLKTQAFENFEQRLDRAHAPGFPSHSPN